MVHAFSVRVEKEDRDTFIAFCNSVGMTPAAAINMFIKAVNREHRIPFEISDSSNPSHTPSDQRQPMKSAQQTREDKLIKGLR